MKDEDYNQEHYDKLKEGVESWNEWREENPTIQPLLRDADLRASDLGGANLEGTNLRGANLWAAGLRGADLRDADLRNTTLLGANNLTVGQICEAKNLYRAVLATELKKQTKEKCPSKLTEWEGETKSNRD